MPQTMTQTTRMTATCTRTMTWTIARTTARIMTQTMARTLRQLQLGGGDERAIPRPRLLRLDQRRPIPAAPPATQVPLHRTQPTAPAPFTAGGFRRPSRGIARATRPSQPPAATPLAPPTLGLARGWAAEGRAAGRGVCRLRLSPPTSGLARRGRWRGALPGP